MSVDTKGDYNAAEYNEVMYNDNDMFLSLLESLSCTDGTKTVDDYMVRLETLTLADNLQKYFNGAIFNEAINASDVRLMEPAKNLPETLSISDERIVEFLKALPETVTLADLLSFQASRTLQDFIVLVDALTKQITDKRLPSETIRLNDWLQIRNSSDHWGE